MVVLCPYCFEFAEIPGPQRCRCGWSFPVDFEIQKYIDAQRNLTAHDALTLGAKRYRQRVYPLDGSNPLNRLFGGIFSAGYCTRAAEEVFNRVFCRDVSLVDHPPQVRAAIHGGRDAGTNIAAVAEVLDEQIVRSLDQEWSDLQRRKYPMLDFDQTNDVLSILSVDLVKQHKDYFKATGVNESLAEAGVALNLYCGYYYRVAEEIVGLS